MAGTFSTLPQGTVLSDRYKILRQIGQGGFGRTYLALDSHRYDEYCVLKEFAPIVKNETNLRKAEELFEREAGILYQLKHSRIPQFKALLRTQIYNKRTLFLVQEYIAGKTYDQLLKSQGKFTESQVIKLMNEILPTLTYIHQQKLIHRDISPDNLICRQADQKPVLIDFGCVKLAANAVSRSQGYGVTLIGKQGYAPEEQIRNGSTFASSDLYALAVTIIVLLTDKSPDQLYDTYQGKWQWEKEVNVSSHLTKILNKMLAYHPCDRYQDAATVIKALSQHSLSANSLISRMQTFIVAPKNLLSTNQNIPTKITQSFVSQIEQNFSRLKTKAFSQVDNKLSQKSSAVSHSAGIWRQVLIMGTLFVVPGAITFAAFQSQQKFLPIVSLEQAMNKTFATLRNISPFNSSLAVKEQNQQQNIYQRIQTLNINSGTFFNQVDREFYRQYPEMRNLTLTNSQQHRQYRLMWYQIAEKLLTQQEKKN